MSLGRFVSQMALRAETEKNVGLHGNAWRRQYFRLIKSDNHHPQEVLKESQVDFESRREEVILDFLNSRIPHEPVVDLDSEAQNLSRLFVIWKKANPYDSTIRSINYSDLERVAVGLLLFAQKAKFEAADDPLDLELADGLLTYYFRVARVVGSARKLAQFSSASSF